MKRVTKSVTALLLALVLSLTLLPAQALAADTAPATQTYTGTAYVGAHTNPVYARGNIAPDCPVGTDRGRRTGSGLSHRNRSGRGASQADGSPKGDNDTECEAALRNGY